MGNAVLEKKFTLFEAADMQIINGWVATEILQFFVQCAMLGFELTNFRLHVRGFLFHHKVGFLAFTIGERFIITENIGRVSSSRQARIPVV